MRIAAAVAVTSLLPVAAQAQYAEASIRLVVKPKTATVYVDGYFSGQVEDYDGTFERLHIEAGQHELVLYLAGYRPLVQRLYFSPNQTRKITATLERLGPGEEDPGPPVPSNPPQRFDPPQRPDPPDSRRMPPNGRGGFPPAPPDRGPDTDRGSSQVGTLSVRVQPGDTELFVDGERWPVGASGDERLIIQLSDGRHLVEVNKPGYQRFSTEVDVHAGRTANLNISLTKEH